MIQENLKAAFVASKLYVKEIATKSGVNKSTIDGWISTRAYEPRPIDLYAVCKVVDITMEQVIDGDAGAEYVRQWAKREGKVYSPPDQIADIVNALKELSSHDLNIVRGTINGILGKDAIPEIHVADEKKEA
jgi:transcriptional regulator with XRE-family HTH domain